MARLGRELEGGIDEGSEAFAFDADGEPSWSLVSALRLRHASQDERDGGAAFAILDGDELTTESEIRAWEAAREIADAMRAHFRLRRHAILQQVRGWASDQHNSSRHADAMRGLADELDATLKEKLRD